MPRPPVLVTPSNITFVLVLKGPQSKLCSHVQIIKPYLMIAFEETIKHHRDPIMEWREAIVQICLGGGPVPEVECEHVAIVTDGVILKAIAFRLVRTS